MSETLMAAPTVPVTVDLAFAEEAVARLGRTPDAVIPMLQALQDHYGYLPEEALEHVCHHTQITPAAITGVSTFYDMFRHEPVGKHIVHVCHGTACHVGGAERVEDALRRHLRIPAGANTDAGPAVHDRTRRLPRLLHARAGGADRGGDDRLRVGGEGAGRDPRVPGRAGRRPIATQPLASTPKRGADAAEFQGVPRLLLRGQGHGPRLPRVAGKRRANRRERHGEARRLRRARVTARR